MNTIKSILRASVAAAAVALVSGCVVEPEESAPVESAGGDDGNDVQEPGGSPMEETPMEETPAEETPTEGSASNGNPCGGSTPYFWTAAEQPGARDDLKATKTVTVSNGTELAKALASAAPGHHIVLKDGTYSGTFKTTKDGEKSAPIVIEAENPLKAKLESAFVIASDYTVLSGVDAVGVGLELGGKFSRITRSRVNDYLQRRPIAVSINASYGRIDHNEVGNYHQQGISFVTDNDEGAHHMWIDHNWIHDKLAAPAGTNDNLEEAIQVGESHGTSLSHLKTVIEGNLIENNMDADDAISLKSSEHIVCGNTLIDAKGGIVTRFGDDSVVISNYLENTKIKVLGAGHKVIGNVLLEGGNIEARAGNIPENTTSPQPACNTSGKAAAMDVLLAGNKGPLSIGDTYNATCDKYPARDIVIEAHEGTITSNEGTTKNVSKSKTTAETWTPAKKLARAEVGPAAP